MPSLTPEDIFTPRAAKVNKQMYVHRPKLEKRLKNGLRSPYHLLIHGESGCGKTWLYKSVLNEEDVYFYPANMANVARHKSLEKELLNILGRLNPNFQTEYHEKKSASGGLSSTKAELSHEKRFETRSIDTYELLLGELQRKSKGKKGCLILDNFEAILKDNDLVEQAANLIILLDDDAYADKGIKLLLVGVPSNMREYFSSLPNASTVSNRIVEIPEVERLSPNQAVQLFNRGFGFLKYTIEVSDAEIRHICWLTDCVPQQIHSLCLQIAFHAQDKGGIVDPGSIDEGIESWLETSMLGYYSACEAAMNSKDTKAGRRNQTLFALSLCEKEDFRYSDIEKLVRNEFADSTESKQLNISQILSSIASLPTPIIRKTAKGDEYRFTDNRYRIVLRAMLKKDQSGKVMKLQYQVHI